MNISLGRRTALRQVGIVVLDCNVESISVRVSLLPLYFMGESCLVDCTVTVKGSSATGIRRGFCQGGCHGR